MEHINLKNLFYKGYYKGIDFRKGGGNKEAIEDYNAAIFKRRNQRIEQYSPNEKYLNFLDLEKMNLPHYKEITLETIYPGLLIGSGYIHETNTKEELKLGFFFDHTTGIPIIPGSSVKGVLRSAFPTFKPQEEKKYLPQVGTEKQSHQVKLIQAFCPSIQSKSGEELTNLVHQLEYALFAGYDILTSISEKKLTYKGMRQRCRFLDAIIESTAPNGRIVGTDALTPHGKNALKNPTPLPFLKILAQVKIKFQFQIQPITLQGGVIIEVEELVGLFQQLFLTFGVGAKTNVGYGQFTTLPERIIFQEKQEIEGVLIKTFWSIERCEYEFRIEGNIASVKMQIKNKLFDKYSEGEIVQLTISKLHEDGSIKYVNLAKKK